MVGEVTLNAVVVIFHISKHILKKCLISPIKVGSGRVIFADPELLLCGCQQVEGCKNFSNSLVWWLFLWLVCPFKYSLEHVTWHRRCKNLRLVRSKRSQLAMLYQWPCNGGPSWISEAYSWTNYLKRLCNTSRECSNSEVLQPSLVFWSVALLSSCYIMHWLCGLFWSIAFKMFH